MKMREYMEFRKNLSIRAKACMKELRQVWGGKGSMWFEVEAGLRQGCPLLPALYVMGPLKDLGGLLYADDIVATVG